MSVPQVAIAITADDKTAKGWSAAEKRAGGSIKRIGVTGKDGLKATQEGIGRSSRGIVKSFSAIEQAGKSALSGGSIIGRASAIRDVGILARGMGAAAAEGLGLEGAMAGVAGAAVGMTGAVVLAGAAMWKLSDGWGKGANQLGNMANLMGVSTSALQKFAGAAERVGVDKDTATSTLGSLSQTLNDARYGRNNGALAILGKMGVKLQTNEDGTVNVEAMLPQIATAIAAQNSSGRRTAGHALGISDAALAAFTQGGGNLSAGMADYGRNGAMMTDADTKLGRDLTERDVSAAQRVGKAWMGVQRWNATAVKGTGDALISAAGDASKISPPSLIGPAEAQTLPAAGSADGIGGSAGGGFRRAAPTRTLRLSAQGIEDLKKTTDTEWNHHSIEQGRGVVDTILNRTASGHWGRSVRSVVDAKSQFSDINGRVAWQKGRHSVRNPGLQVRLKLIEWWMSGSATAQPVSHPASAII